jgi:hypothetical protein
MSQLRASVVRLAQDVAYGRSPHPSASYRQNVAWDETGNALVQDVLATGRPCLVTRFGSVELACVSFYARWRSGRTLALPYPAQLRRAVRVNAGVFPTDDASLDRFAEVYLQAAGAADIMGVWFNRGEDDVVARFCPEARLVHLESLNPVLWKRPWSAGLAGRTVLVVHPFVRTIESQYRTRRARLFENPATLPTFELKTLRAVQSHGANACGHSDWFEALDHMRRRIEETDFDVAVIGAGAYGLPLGAFVKDMGRQAVHLGGATQLLFGVRGRRWEVESPDDIALVFNEHWVRPSAEEMPDGAEMIEGGCYW